MFYELVSPDGSVVAAGEFTDTDAKAPRNGLIDRLAITRAPLSAAPNYSATPRAC